MLENGAGFADHEIALVAGLDQHRRQARRIQAGEFGWRFPVADLHLDERQPLLAQRKTHLPRGGVQGEVVKGAFDAHAQVRSGCIERAMRRFA
jgi:hypothetical protein